MIPLPCATGCHWEVMACPEKSMRLMWFLRPGEDHALELKMHLGGEIKDKYVVIYEQEVATDPSQTDLETKMFIGCSEDGIDPGT